MTIEEYGIAYTTPGIDKTRREIVTLRDALINLDIQAKEAKATLGGLGKGDGGNAAKSLTAALSALKGAGTPVTTIRDAMEGIAGAAFHAKGEIRDLATSLGYLRGSVKDVGQLASRFDWLADRTIAARANVASVGGELTKIAPQVGTLDALRDAMQRFQRTTYGAGKNLEGVNAGILQAGVGGASLGTLADPLSGIGKGFAGASTGARRFGVSLDGLAARMAALHGLKDAIQAMGKAFEDARSKASEGAGENLERRDQYRELANLQGKAEPDNAVMAGVFKFRISTGTTDREARDALQRFEGALPAARDKGNIVGTATDGPAADYFREASRIGTRVKLSGATTGELAALIPQYGKVPTTDVGISQFQSVVDVLNKGKDALTPLVQAVVSGSAGMVGQGQRFQTIGDFASAEAVFNTAFSPKVAATRIRQAVTALNRYGERAPLGRFGQLLGAGPKAGDTLNRLGIGGGERFEDAIDKLAPLMTGENVDLNLTQAGFGNQAERRALIFAFENRGLLRQWSDSTRKGADPATVRAANAQFFASDTAQARIATAEVDAAKFAQFAKDEPVAIARKRAQAALRNRNEFDNAGALAEEAAMDNPFARGASIVTSLMLGRIPKQEQMPLFLGGKPARDMRVDAEALRMMEAGAAGVGLNVDALLNNRFGGPASPEERMSALASATRERGGATAGTSSGTEKMMDLMIFEQRRTNQLLEKANAANGQPAFLPQRPPAPQRVFFSGDGF